VARLGLNWLKSKSFAESVDRVALVPLANAQCEAVGADIAVWALSRCGSADVYRTDAVIQFFDSLNLAIRHGAWDWLTFQTPGFVDPALWSRLLETPYDDVRIRLIEELQLRTRGASLPPIGKQDLSPIWTSVLLGVHRGGRAKLTALRQVSEAIAAQPDDAERLLPVLAIAIRSVRPPEARAGLAAILSAVAVRPELEAALARQIPELRLTPAEAQR
jgi:hypothetical protein